MINATELGYKSGEATVYVSVGAEALRYLDAAPKIKASGQRALNTADILLKRLVELEAFAEKYNNQRWTKENFEKECPWNAYYFDTSTASIATPDFIVIQHNSPQLAAVTPETEIYNGGLKSNGFLEGGKIRFYSGEILNKLKKDKLLNKALHEKQVVDEDKIHPIWGGYADGNNNLIQRLTHLTFKALRDVYNHEEGMGTYFAEDSDLHEVILDYPNEVAGKMASARPTEGWSRMHIGALRLIGVAQGKEVTEGGAPKVLPYTPADVEAAIAVMTELREGTRLAPGRLRPLEQLLAKLL